MINFTRDKKVITQAVLDELPFSKDNNELEKSLYKWWRNIRSTGGLRLSAEGDNAFRLAGIESWDIKAEDNDSKIMLNMASGALDLDRYMPCPYFLYYDKADKIGVVRIYDGRVGVMIQLHGGIASYINSLKLADK